MSEIILYNLIKELAENIKDLAIQINSIQKEKNEQLDKIYKTLDNYNTMIGKLEYKVFMLEQQLKENNNK